MSLINIDVDDNQLILSGVLTFSTTLEALELAKSNFPEKGLFIINLSGITRSDSSGLALLCELIREARKRNLEISFKNIPSHLDDLIRVSGVDSILFET